MKNILFKENAKYALKKGMTAVADFILPTIGPCGTNVIYKDGNGLQITNDGEKMSDQVSPEDPTEEIGAEVIKSAGRKATKESGDGRKTTMALTYAIISEGLKRISFGVDVLAVREGILAAGDDLCARLDKMAKKVSTKEELKQVATISSQSAEIGAIVSEIVHKIGKDGVVSIEDGISDSIEYETAEGLEFSAGYASPYMITNKAALTCEIINAPVVITDKRISTLDDIVPLLELMVKNMKKTTFLLIAEDIDQTVLNFLVGAILAPGGVKVAFVKAPGYGDRKIDYLNDIAVVCGATVLRDGFAGITAEAVGYAKKVVITKNKTKVIGGTGTGIKKYLALLEEQKSLETNAYVKEMISNRIAQIAGGISIIRVGADTEEAAKYLQKKVDDAINATKRALAHGVVAGGGTALAKAADMCESKSTHPDFLIGYNIVLAAAEMPLRHIVANANTDAGIVVNEIKKKNWAYDAKRKVYGDMMALGIIDALKVIKSCVKIACSDAGIFLTVGASSADKLES